jgi:predicted nucleic acid-binding protein
MDLYAESSAVLAWLLDEGRDGLEIQTMLADASTVVASDLTLIECDRVLARAAAIGEITEADAAERQARLNGASAHWAIVGIEEDVVERTRRPFPVEPIRTLDAIHLASALVARRAIPGLTMLSLDARVRRAAHGMGIPLAPPETSPSGS